MLLQVDLRVVTFIHLERVRGREIERGREGERQGQRERGIEREREGGVRERDREREAARP